MDDLPLPQEPDDVVDVRVIGQPKDIVVGQPGLLLRRQILRKVGQDVAGGLHGGGRPGITGGELGIDAGGVIHKVGVKAGSPDLLLGEAPGELMDDGGHHLHMAQLLGADVGEQRFQLGIGHGIALGEVAHGGAQFTVRPAVLADDD